jgi:hypothetical protein
MSKRLDLPPELQALIEKREQADRRQSSNAPDAAAEALDLEERRQADRRAQDRDAAE